MGLNVTNVRTWTEDGNKILKVAGMLVPTDTDDPAGGYVSGGVYPNLTAYVASGYVSVVSFDVVGFAHCDKNIATGLFRQVRYTAHPIVQDPGNQLGVSVSVAFFDGGTELAAGQGSTDVRAHFPTDILNAEWRFIATYSK